MANISQLLPVSSNSVIYLGFPPASNTPQPPSSHSSVWGGSTTPGHPHTCFSSPFRVPSSGQSTSDPPSGFYAGCSPRTWLLPFQAHMVMTCSLDNGPSESLPPFNTGNLPAGGVRRAQCPHVPRLAVSGTGQTLNVNE